MIIDQLMPEYDFRERHGTTVRAEPGRIYEALTTADLSSSRLVKILLAARALPTRMFGTPGAVTAPRPRTLRDAERFGFFIVAENPPHELVIALQGKFWTVSGGMACASRVDLESPLPAGYARAVWNFSVHPRPDGASTLETETRISCGDASSRLKFRLYWMFVRPGSGLIRRMMLRAIRDQVATVT